MHFRYLSENRFYGFTFLWYSVIEICKLRSHAEAAGSEKFRKGNHMENHLKLLFDFQKFMQNNALNQLISDVDARYAESAPVPLDDADLRLASAAGIPEVPENKPILHGEKRL